mgnify:CR=1 FL=1
MHVFEKAIEILLREAGAAIRYRILNEICNTHNITERIQLKRELEDSEKAKRILLTGCPSTGVIQKVGMTIENNGGVIVCLDDCGGERTQKMMVDENADDILRAISDRYLEIHCSVMTTNEGRIENTKAMCEKYKVDGVVEMVLQACHTFNVEATPMGRMVEDMGIPYLKMETDYSTTDSGQIETRIAAFIEML